MRLLYIASDGRLRWTKDYIGIEEIPAYAILSHTWGEQEVTFRDLEKHSDVELTSGKLRTSYQKILFCAQQAKRDGLDHFWVDSCCIDKSNNTELSEAINSMFRWYQNAERCYVYLSDVQNNTLDQGGESSLRGSRWFTRGWTLQELLAPGVVEFFSAEGMRLCDKQSLRNVIHEITGVPVEAISGSTLSDFSIDDRFSWAENRQTTREEDKSYCLLGIFGVYLPLIYGEGEENALHRLRDAVHMMNDRSRSQRSNKRRAKMCSQLSAPDPSTNYHKAHKLRQANTGLWLLESPKFTTWKKHPGSRLWLYGIPGCGKTILSSSIIEHLLQCCNNETSTVTACFYFDFNDAQKQNPELMLRSLLCQLLSRSPMIPKSVDVLFSSFENGQRQPSLQELLESTRQMVQHFRDVYIVLDALDECKQRQELMDLLETVAEWQLENLHLLMTSRKERDIEQSLENYVDEEDIICLLSDVVDADIQRYVQQRLSVDRDLAKWNRDATVRQEIESALMSGARGMFRWAVCQLDALAKCRNRVTLRKSLATLPQTLDQTYDRILTAIIGEDCEYARRILQWLTFSMRPMLIEEVAEVVTIDVGHDPAFDRDEVLEDPLEALNICSSLVTISTIQAEEPSGPHQRIIALAHYSVQEYLLSDRIKQGPAKQYSMLEAQCHGIIMDSCLKYILQLERPLSQEIIQTSTLARYAAEFWSSHLGQTGEDMQRWSQAAIGLMSTENPAYLTWIQLYDLDHPWKSPNLSIRLETAAAPLYYAALLGLDTVTNLLLEQGAEVDTRGGRFGNALHAALAEGHKEVVSMLLKAGADIYAPAAGDGDTNALYEASFGGHELIVKLLLENNADANAQGGMYGNALQAAVAYNHQGIAQLLLDSGANVNQQGGYYGNALNAAATRGNMAFVELLLKNGADASRHDPEGKSALHHATHSSLSLVKFLLSKGAPINTIDCMNMTPLHYSVSSGNKAIVGLLLDNNLSVDTGVHRRLWSRKAWKEDVVYWIPDPDSGPEITCKSAGLTPLHLAALIDDSDMTKFLLQRGADPNALSRYNESPLHLALRKSLHGPRDDDHWTYLLNKFEDLLKHADQEDANRDAIHANTRTRREDVLDVLLADARTSLRIGDHENEYPLHCVQDGRFGSVSMVQKLVSRGANPFGSNLKRQTALHLASRAGDPDAIALLLSLGVEPASTDSDGLNALHYAARSGNHQTIDTLLEATVVTTPSLVLSKDTAGRNLLHHLLSGSSEVHHETIQLLLDKGVDASELDTFGDSPFSSYFRAHQASVDVGMCQKLLSIKANSLFMNSEGQNLGHLCTLTRKFSIRVLEALNEHGVDLTQKDFQSRTILHYAAIRGNITEKNLHYLLHVVGIEIDAEDAEEKTALQYAEMTLEDQDLKKHDRERWESCTRLLLNAGASQAVHNAIES